MKKILISVCTIGLIVTSIATTAYAFTHSSDEWNYGPKPSLINWSKTSQFSDFYCGSQKHHATARIKSGGVLHEDKVYASSKKWAKAQTDYYKDVTEWNSYYGHD